MICQHRLTTCDIPADYSVCEDCGTFVSSKPATGIYDENYWKRAEHDSIWRQVWNVDMHTENGVSKNRFILDMIETDRNDVLEIGCAPGRLLYWLKWAADFKHIVGVTTDDYSAVRSIGCFDGELISNLFPVATTLQPEKSFDLIIALDVFEHVLDSRGFLKECFRLLRNNGQLILMLPLADDLPLDSRFFNPPEHIFIHSRRHMAQLIEDAGMVKLGFSRWTIGHDVISARKMT